MRYPAQGRSHSYSAQASNVHKMKRWFQFSLVDLLLATIGVASIVLLNLRTQDIGSGIFIEICGWPFTHSVEHYSDPAQRGIPEIDRVHLMLNIVVGTIVVLAILLFSKTVSARLTQKGIVGS
jgi:hypothetical protein